MAKISKYFLFITLLAKGCINCPVHDITEISNLKNNTEIIGYIMDCGATTESTINISIKKSEMDINSEKGNIFLLGEGLNINY